MTDLKRSVGVASFFYEPAKGIVHGPEEFAKGVATGTMHLIKNSMYGIFNSVGQMTEGVGKTLAMLSFDNNYYQRFQNKPRTTKALHSSKREPVSQISCRVKC